MGEVSLRIAHHVSATFELSYSTLDFPLLARALSIAVTFSSITSSLLIISHVNRGFISLFIPVIVRRT